jgi:hypothetical protein
MRQRGIAGIAILAVLIATAALHGTPRFTVAYVALAAICIETAVRRRWWALVALPLSVVFVALIVMF